MVFEFFAVARIQLIYFDILGRIGDVWGVYGLLGAHKRLLLCHVGDLTCLVSFSVSYTSFCTLASLKLIEISALSFGSFGFLACFLFDFSTLA
jgi:hypothetical protein